MRRVVYCDRERCEEVARVMPEIVSFEGVCFLDWFRGWGLFLGLFIAHAF